MLSLLYITIPAQYFFAYFIFFSALIVTIRSDLETMLISRFATIFLLPLGIVLSIFGLLPISPIESIASALGGYFFLYIIGKIFYFIKRKNGIGQGDLDLLAFIGAFTGILGLWVTVLFGSIAGSLIGLLYLVITNKPGNSTHIPFGPFLAFAAMAFVLFYYARIHHAF